MRTKPPASPVKVYPFHGRYPGLPDLFHVSCDQHPGFGFCGTYDEADATRLKHLATHERPGVSSPARPAA